MSSAADPKGTSIDGKYRLIELLGAEGSVLRYLAEHTSIGRPVEVHFLAAGEPPDGEAAAELLRTARVLGLATHPNVQSVVDSGRDAQGRPFVVFEAPRGRTLAELCGEHPSGMDRVRVARIVVQVLEALRALHDAGVVLRTLCPLDIAVDSELVKLRGLHDAALLIEAGAAPVPPSVYVAPELTREPGLDPRVDFYSVGVMLRELLTGDPGGDMRGLSDTAHRAIARACAEDPDDRFSSVDAFLQAVSLLLPTSQRPPRDEIPTPADPLHADLHYLHLRRTTRHGARVRSGESRLSLLPVLLTIEAVYRQFGPGVWAQISERIPEADALLPGAGHTPVHMERGVPVSLFAEILVAIDEIGGAGDLALVAELGEAIAKRGMMRLFPDLPEPLTVDGLVASFPYLWSRMSRDGKARVSRTGERSARLIVERQATPALELCGLMAGLFRQALREAGASAPSVVLMAAEAVGDPRDLYGVDW